MSEVERAQAVRTVVARIARTIDTRRWQELRALYADEVTSDYTSLFGGEIPHQSGDDLIETWRRLLSSLDATQHMVGPIEVHLQGDRALAECHVRGYHVCSAAPGGSEWMVAGQWIIELVERERAWLVTKMTLRTFYQTGNRDLLREAAGE